jgi:FemAB-related protein (PEP-CTERM system-associated)
MQHTSASRAFTHDGSRRLISLTEEPARCLADARSYVVKTLEASERERERWNEYVRVHREATFFHRAEWGEVLTRAFGHRSRYLYAESGGRIAGVLPLVEVKSLLFGHALVSTPFCVYGGCLADEEGASRALEDAACELGRELGVDYIEMRNRKPRNRGWLTKDLYVTFRRPIDPDPERNMLAIPRKQRAMVRKGIQKQLLAEIDSGTERAYHLYAESLRNLGTPVFSRRYMALLKETFREQCEVVTVVHAGQPVASVLSFYFRDEVLPYYGGGAAAARGVAGNDFMYWQVMERARERGARVFDFGRSKRGSGSFEFKAHWGFEPEPLSYEYLLIKARGMPNLSPTNSKYARLIGLWRRLPVPLTCVIGPPIARYLG